MPGKISPTLRSARTKLSAKLLTTVQYTPPPSSQQTRFISETILRSLMPAAHPLERRSTFKLPRRKDQNWWFPPKVSRVAFTWSLKAPRLRFRWKYSVIQSMKPAPAIPLRASMSFPSVFLLSRETRTGRERNGNRKCPRQFRTENVSWLFAPRFPPLSSFFSFLLSSSLYPRMRFRGMRALAFKRFVLAWKDSGGVVINLRDGNFSRNYARSCFFSILFFSFF